MSAWSDYHVHSVYCDGSDAPEELIKSAVKKEFRSLGILFHSHTGFDENYCIKKKDIPLFFDEILELKKKYSERLEIYAGTEQDFFSEPAPEKADYIIGSVHYIKMGESYVPVDESAEILKAAADEYFGGDMLKLAEAYYAEEAQTAKKTKCHIIGHFDLITKFNEGYALFDENNRQYRLCALSAAEELLKSCRIFELNTGTMSRGYRSEPYPADFILKYLREKNAEIILSGDAHCAKNIGFEFESAAERLKSLGFKQRVEIKSGRFVSAGL